MSFSVENESTTQERVYFFSNPEEMVQNAQDGTRDIIEGITDAIQQVTPEIARLGIILSTTGAWEVVEGNECLPGATPIVIALADQLGISAEETVTPVINASVDSVAQSAIRVANPSIDSGIHSSAATERSITNIFNSC
ncbi:MAG: hypothetical protein K940chlam6_00470 [Chlamydiae bacterium]|nr:hypothetical protein [Chlamydiota bacterium]